MPKCTIDGKEYEFTPGETVIQIADRNNIDVPRFCYHPGLSVVAQCRMCAVEVEKMPKLQTACSLPATEGMVVQTQSEKVKQTRASVMEFTLINHPLDCPICDEAGECQLQDYSFAYGKRDQRYDEERRTFIDLDMGPVIKKNMNRCIHCTRCIRFCDEVSGYREMVALKRGNSTEIATVDGKPLETQYAGNLADICPTGSLTLIDFRFKKRAWFLKKTPSICENCSQGCNLEIHEEENQIYRHVPRENMSINKWWLCDEGRFGFKYVNAPDRIVDPILREKGSTDFIVSDWNEVLTQMKSSFQGKALILAGSDLTQEELQAIQRFAQTHVQQYDLFHFGTKGVSTTKDDAEEDRILRRLSKTSNLNGAEQLGLKPFVGNSASPSYSIALVFRGGRAVLPEDFSKNVQGPIYGIGVFHEPMIQGWAGVLPGLSYAEKAGTVINWQGVAQRFHPALKPVGQSKSLSEIFELWV